MYFSFRAGKILLWKAAQWPHVIEAYSTMVTGASALPSARSGSGPGFISSSAAPRLGRPCGAAHGRLAASGPRRAADGNGRRRRPPIVATGRAAGDGAGAMRRSVGVGHGGSILLALRLDAAQRCAAWSGRADNISLATNKANPREQRGRCDGNFSGRPGSPAPSRASAPRSPASAMPATSRVSGSGRARGSCGATGSRGSTGACTMRNSAMAA